MPFRSALVGFGKTLVKARLEKIFAVPVQVAPTTGRVEPLQTVIIALCIGLSNGPLKPLEPLAVIVCSAMLV